MQDELFGPILPCARFTDVEAALTLVRELPTGKPLALYAFAKDEAFLKAVRR